MAWKIEPRSIKKPIENTMKKRRHLGDVLAASWLVLEASWGVPKSMDAALTPGAVAETQGPLLGRIPKGLGLLGKNIIRK